MLLDLEIKILKLVAGEKNFENNEFLLK